MNLLLEMAIAIYIGVNLSCVYDKEGVNLTAFCALLGMGVAIASVAASIARIYIMLFKPLI